VSFNHKAYHRARYLRLTAANLCLDCELPHSSKHVRCPDCHAGHIETSRDKYVSRGTGFTCGACGGEGHNRRTCGVARAA
jgi:hypothetical protein